MATLKARIEALRERFAWFDHVLTMLGHYGRVNGNDQAGAVTYFGFLSFFPILALAVFVIGLLARVYPDIQEQMTVEINNLVPGVIGSGPGEVDLDTLGSYSGLAGLVGLAGVLYAGLGWLSGLRRALEVMFVVPARAQPNFVFGKLRDLGTLALVGLVLMVSVVLSGAVTGFSSLILELVGIDPGAALPQLVLTLLGHALAVLASTLLLLAMFKLLVTESGVPRRAMVKGALLGAVGFEVLKLAANLLLAQTRGQPAFQAFGVALILVVWINYFSRLVMYAAAWAYTAPTARERRAADAVRAPGAAVGNGSENGPGTDGAGTDGAGGPSRRPWAAAAGGAAVGGALAWVLRGPRG